MEKVRFLIHREMMIFLIKTFHHRTREILGFRFGRHELPSVADPPQGRKRLRDAIKDLRHPTEYYDWFRHTIV